MGQGTTTGFTPGVLKTLDILSLVRSFYEDGSLEWGPADVTFRFRFRLGCGS